MWTKESYFKLETTKFKCRECFVQYIDEIRITNKELIIDVSSRGYVNNL